MVSEWLPILETMAIASAPTGFTNVEGVSADANPAGYVFGSTVKATITGISVNFRFYAEGNLSDQAFTPTVYAVFNGEPTHLLAAGPTVTVRAHQGPEWHSVPLAFTVITGSTYCLALVPDLPVDGDPSHNVSTFYRPGGSDSKMFWAINPIPEPASHFGGVSTVHCAGPGQWLMALDVTPLTQASAELAPKVYSGTAILSAPDGESISVTLSFTFTPLISPLVAGSARLILPMPGSPS